MTHDVVCTTCGGSYHETTDKYVEGKRLNGSMFKLKKRFGPSGENWVTFPGDPWIMDADLECPWCGGNYNGGGCRFVKNGAEEENKEGDGQKKEEQAKRPERSQTKKKSKGR